MALRGLGGAQNAHVHSLTHVSGFLVLHQLPVAVVHEHDEVAALSLVLTLNVPTHALDLDDGNGWAERVAA